MKDFPHSYHKSHASDEFGPGASEWPEGVSRREFLRLSGATLALAGLGACTKQPLEKIVPYVEQPEIVIPGKPLRFATATQYSGFGQGLLVTSYEGRPTKIEGNPSHPASLGATSGGPRQMFSIFTIRIGPRRSPPEERSRRSTISGTL